MIIYYDNIIKKMHINVYNKKNFINFNRNLFLSGLRIRKNCLQISADFILDIFAEFFPLENLRRFCELFLYCAPAGSQICAEMGPLNCADFHYNKFPNDGPLYSFWYYSFERMNGLLGNININII